MNKEIDFEIPAFFPDYIKEKLKPLMIFSDEDNLKQWAVYFHDGKFTYQKSKPKISGKYFFELEGNELSKDFDKINPIFIVPLDDLAKVEFLNLSKQNINSNFFNFKKVSYYHKSKKDFQIVNSQIEHLSSRAYITVKESVTSNSQAYLQILYLEGDEKKYFDYQLQQSNVKELSNGILSVDKDARLFFDDIQIFKVNDDDLQNITTTIETTDDFDALFHSKHQFGDNEKKGILRLNTNELKVFYYKNLLPKTIEILQLNNEIFTKYACEKQTKTNFLSQAFSQIEA